MSDLLCLRCSRSKCNASTINCLLFFLSFFSTFRPKINVSYQDNILSLAGAATSIIFVATYLVVTKLCLSRRNIFVAAKRLLRQIFFATKVIFRQENFCCDKSMLVVTKHLSWQTRVCQDKQNFCHDKHTFVAKKDILCSHKHVFVAINTCLSRQKIYLWQLPPMIGFVVSLVDYDQVSHAITSSSPQLSPKQSSSRTTMRCI